MGKNGGFFKSNWAYLIWFALYYLIAVCFVDEIVENIGFSFLVTTIIYGISLLIALNPMGEAIARLLEGIKPIQTQEDKDYLLPIFDEVYQEALEYTPSLNKDIKLYMLDSMAVNAFALGSKTIAVTKGAVYTFSREELKGILGHEFGHIVNGDTKALQMTLVGNGFFTVIIFVLRLLARIMEVILISLSGKDFIRIVVAFVVTFARWIIDLYIFIFVLIGDIILALNSRHSEYLADEYAVLIGYGTELKQSLYILSKLAMPSKLTLLERLKSSHPYTTARIEKLENLGA